MPTVVLKLFAGQGNGWMDNRTDGQSGDYMLPSLGSIKKEKNISTTNIFSIEGKNDTG